MINHSNQNFEIHPLWLRERAKTESLVDKYNDQRLYDPSQLDQNLKIKNASMTNGHLNIEFTDGVKFDYEVNNLLYEIQYLQHSFAIIQKTVFLLNTCHYKMLQQYCHQNHDL